MLLSVFIAARSVLGLPLDLIAARIQRGDAGQATAEYALVLLGAAAIAVLLVNFASGGAFTHLFESVLSKVTSNVGK